MLPRSDPARIQAAFDDHRLVANAGDKMMTLVASALAGGDCIDDADAQRAGETAPVQGCVVKAPSTLGTFLRSFRWGRARQLDRVSREVMARAWAAGAGPGDELLTIDHIHAFGSSTELSNCLADPRQAAGLRGSLDAMCTPISPVADAASGQKVPSRRRHPQRLH